MSGAFLPVSINPILPVAGFLLLDGRARRNSSVDGASYVLEGHIRDIRAAPVTLLVQGIGIG